MGGGVLQTPCAGCGRDAGDDGGRGPKRRAGVCGGRSRRRACEIMKTPRRPSAGIGPIALILPHLPVREFPSRGNPAPSAHHRAPLPSTMACSAPPPTIATTPSSATRTSTRALHLTLRTPAARQHLALLRSHHAVCSPSAVFASQTRPRSAQCSPTRTSARKIPGFQRDNAETQGSSAVVMRPTQMPVRRRGGGRRRRSLWRLLSFGRRP